MNRLRYLALGFAVAGLVGLGSQRAFGQLNSTTATVTLTATLGESLTIAATPSGVTFALTPGATTAGNAPVVITTTWVLATGRANVVLDGYFASASAALSYSGTNIPSSEVLGQMTTGSPTTFTAFTGTAALGTAGTGLTLFTQALTAANRSATRTDSLYLEINLASQPQLPAAVYTGTLTLQAQAL